MVQDIGKNVAFEFGNDPIVIRVYGKSIIGGRLLDVEGYTEPYIRMGQIIIRDETNGVSKPLPIVGGSYDSLPEGWVYEGVSKTTTTKEEPFVGVMYEGEVNDLASPYPLNAELLAALKSALPELAFKHS